ncbi:hypothetical protein LIN78_05755 [Leeia sp. TBRC 13508]|uniref:Uncharacterized protein n=1 Tax=Leeia speluncae TaxID=2884804 RepID=A0ABS8D4D0_9NEIS|nr:hypothetical protein [Leeia speluncae]MCB6183052.1 hypothetical protein [Leeia speluncae]
MKKILFFILMLSSFKIFAEDKYMELDYLLKSDKSLAFKLKKEIDSVSSKGNFSKLLTGPSADTKKFTFNNLTFYKYSICQIHFCGPNRSAFFISPSTKEIAGIVVQDESVHVFGNLNHEMKQILSEDEMVNFN